jgi:hypothetical protein
MRSIFRWCIVLCVLQCIPGGVLWSLSPLGVRLATYRFGTPDAFWKLFPSAPGLLLVGLVGTFFWLGRPKGLARIGFIVAVAGMLMVIVGDYGVFYTEIDDRYLLSAPAYRTLRFGLFLMAGGTALFAYGAMRAGTLPKWVALPLLVGSLLGFVSFVRELSYVGGGFWIFYGVTWVWLGLLPPVRGVRAFFERRRKGRKGTPNPARQNADQPL